MDLENMLYEAPEDKINQIIQEVKALEEDQVSQGRVSVRQLATTLGRIGAIRMSHGTIMHTMTRRLQHSLDVIQGSTDGRDTSTLINLVWKS